MKKNLLALHVTLALVASAANAETTQLDEVIVLGTQLEESLPQELQKYGNRLEVITGEQIVKGGFNDAAQALQMLVPGLHVVPKNGAFDYVEASLQGSRRNDILWLIDGVRISNRLYNTTPALDTIPAHMIERIEVLKGGQGLFYGTQSIAGVVNVVTKGFSSTTDGGVGVGLDTNDGRHADAYLRGKLGETSLVGYASYDQADGFEPYRPEDYQPSATKRDRGYDEMTLGVKAAHQFGESITTSLNYQYTDATVDFASPQRILERYNDRQEHIASAKFDMAVSERFDVFVKGYYHEWTTHYTQIDTVPITGARDVVSDAEFWGYQDFGLNLLGQYNLTAGLDLLAGYDRQQFNGSDEVLLIADKTEKVNAFFMQLRGNPELLSRTHFAAGFRYNDVQDGTSSTIWNVSGQVDLNDGLYVRALAGTAFRLPDAYELFAIDPNDILGNPLLEPESSLNYEVGIGRRGVGSKLTWEVIGFRRDVTDLISDDGTTFINSTDELEVTGMEIILGIAFNDSWRAAFDFTHSKAEFVGEDEQAPRIPKDIAKFSLDYTAPSGRFGVGLATAYTGDVSQSVSGGIGLVEFGNYVVVDLTGYAFIDADHRHRVGLRVENVLDEDYASSVMRGIEDVGGASYRVDNLGTPQTLHVKYDYRFGK